MANKKVFCSGCRHKGWVLAKGFFDQVDACRHPDNFKKVKQFNWNHEWEEIVLKRKIHLINKNNDCPRFDEKPIIPSFQRKSSFLKFWIR